MFRSVTLASKHFGAFRVYNYLGQQNKIQNKTNPKREYLDEDIRTHMAGYPLVQCVQNIDHHPLQSECDNLENIRQ